MPILLHRAVVCNQIEVIKELIRNKADVDEYDMFGNTPLYLAASQQNIELMKCLVENGADINKRNRLMDDIALHSACWVGYVDNVAYLIEQGSHINIIDEAGSTPLHDAAVRGKTDIVKLLLDAGAITTIRDAEKKTAYEACYKYEIKTIIKRHDTIHKLKEWRPWNHADYMPHYRSAIKTIMCLAKM